MPDLLRLYSQRLTVMGETGRRAELQRAGRSRKARQGDEPDRGSLNCRRLIAKPALDINSLQLNRLNLFEEAPHADPHVGCCGDWGRKSPGYPIMPRQPYRYDYNNIWWYSF